MLKYVRIAMFVSSEKVMCRRNQGANKQKVNNQYARSTEEPGKKTGRSPIAEPHQEGGRRLKRRKN